MHVCAHGGQRLTSDIFDCLPSNLLGKGLFLTWDSLTGQLQGLPSLQPSSRPSLSLLFIPLPLSSPMAQFIVNVGSSWVQTKLGFPSYSLYQSDCINRLESPSRVHRPYVCGRRSPLWCVRGCWTDVVHHSCLTHTTDGLNTVLFLFVTGNYDPG